MDDGNGSGYDAAMLPTLEQRVEELEKKVVKLNDQLADRGPRAKDWCRSIGAFHNDPHYEEAMRLGRAYRAQQTCEKEIAGS